MPDKGLATQDKDKLRRPSDRKKNNKKRYGKQDMTWDEKNHCYICPEEQKLEQKKDIPPRRPRQNNILRSKLHQMPIKRQMPITEDDNQSNNRLRE